MLRRTIKILGWVFSVIFLLLAGFAGYIYFSPVEKPPTPSSLNSLQANVISPDSGLYQLGKSWFRKSESGFYELYLEGGPFERGVANGKLTKDLVRYQEEIFTRQLKTLVPSSAYRDVLKYLIKYFNRNLNSNVPLEYQLEIFGVSQSASHEFEYVGPAYTRMLNYHAAHDIGHAIQNVSLVGCTSFATWGNASEDSSLIVGRNFDFYLGDDFARDKIIAFYNPEQGHKFMMVTFGGMTGVLSGMNDQGLTVTINAAKSEVPTSSATPVSLVAREILQYASTIKEAYAIAEKRKMFVSESFLIGSAKDGRASIIEKTPNAIDLFEPPGDHIISTNHFQGSPLGDTQLNKDHMNTSASPYRYARVQQLLDKQGKNSVVKTAALLRNQKGLNDKNIGLGNEKSVNQLVAHHAIIFQPEKRLVWVSTAPWQLGKFVCYDLTKIFGQEMTKNHEVYEAQLTIPADSFLSTPQYIDFKKFSQFRFPFNPHSGLQPDSLIKWNPDSYHAYMLAGDFYLDHKEFAKAIPVYERGLGLEIATVQEREHMEKNLHLCQEKTK
jgi:isopenicillin-N N-acyltransferase like protein